MAGLLELLMSFLSRISTFCSHILFQSTSVLTGRKTWLYEYAYRASFFKYEPWVNGSHVDDIYTLFGEPFMEVFRSLLLRGEWNNNDRMVRDVHQKYFANFAYTGFVPLNYSVHLFHFFCEFCIHRVCSRVGISASADICGGIGCLRYADTSADM